MNDLATTAIRNTSSEWIVDGVTFKRIIEYDPATDFGRFVLKGPNGATQFVVILNTQFRDDPTAPKTLRGPMGVDVGYHAYEPQHEGQEPFGECQFLDGEICYYDGSGMAGMDLADAVQEKGINYIWEVLLARYKRIEPRKKEQA